MKNLYKKALNDYLEINNLLKNNLKNNDNLIDIYNYLDKLSKDKQYKLSFTNVDLETEKYIDFNFKNILVTIYENNMQTYVLLDNIEIYDENGVHIETIMLEKLLEKTQKEV